VEGICIKVLNYFYLSMLKIFFIPAKNLTIILQSTQKEVTILINSGKKFITVDPPKKWLNLLKAI